MRRVAAQAVRAAREGLTAPGSGLLRGEGHGASSFEGGVRPALRQVSKARATHATEGSRTKAIKPTSPGMRHRVVVQRDNLHKGRPFKPLTQRIPRSAGRDSRGRIRVWHRGGGHRKIYRIIDFKRHKEGKAIVQRLEYDPNRSATIALLAHEDTGQLHSYIICPQGVAIGEDVYAGTGSPIKRGSCLPLSEIPIGTRVHNIELQPGKGGQLVRAAGTAATVVRTRADGYAQLRLRSGEQRLIHSRCKATIGTVSNEQHQNRVVGKAGINRLKGWRPVTRGVAMNPVDHPHGGGEGRTSGGRPSCSPWGVPTKGYRTRKKNSVSSRFIVRRPKSKPAK